MTACTQPRDWRRAWAPCTQGGWPAPWVNSEAHQVNSAATVYAPVPAARSEPRAEPRRPPRWAPRGPWDRAPSPRAGRRPNRACAVCATSPTRRFNLAAGAIDDRARVLQQVRPISWSDGRAARASLSFGVQRELMLERRVLPFFAGFALVVVLWRALESAQQPSVHHPDLKRLHLRTHQSVAVTQDGAPIVIDPLTDRRLRRHAQRNVSIAPRRSGPKTSLPTSRRFEWYQCVDENEAVRAERCWRASASARARLARPGGLRAFTFALREARTHGARARIAVFRRVRCIQGDLHEESCARRAAAREKREHGRRLLLTNARKQQAQNGGSSRLLQRASELV